MLLISHVFLLGRENFLCLKSKTSIMKKKLRFLLMITAISLFAVNFSLVPSTKADNSLDLQLLGQVASADSECVLNPGDPIYGTNCTVQSVYPGSYYFWFVECWEFCDPGGTNCCYVLSF